MTLEEMLTLNPGDAVYWRVDRYHTPNAMQKNGQPFWLGIRTVVKVNKKTVQLDNGSAAPSEIMSIADGEQAMTEFENFRAAEKALDDRWADVKRRVKNAVDGQAFRDSFYTHHKNQLQVSATSINFAEQIADILEVGELGLKLRNDLSAKLSSESPTIHLFLSVEQARRVLAALESDHA